MDEIITLITVILSGWIIVGLFHRVRRSLTGSKKMELTEETPSDESKGELTTPLPLVEPDAPANEDQVSETDKNLVGEAMQQDKPATRSVVAARFDPDLAVFREKEKLVDAILLPESVDGGSFDDVRIHFTSGELSGEELVLPAGDIIIGRNPTRAQIVVEHPEVSGEHLRLVCPAQQEAFFVVEDLGSTNGTQFRNQRIGLESWVPVSGKERFSAADVSGLEIKLADGAFTFEVENQVGL